MSDVDPQDWAKQIAQALMLGGERIPFQRVLRIHQSGLEALRARGLTWQSLAQLLLRAGVQRPDARPYSADQLRISVARLQQQTARTRTSTTARPAPVRMPRHQVVRRQATPLAQGDPASSQVAAPPASAASPHASAAVGDKDVSHDEIAAARARLRHIR